MYIANRIIRAANNTSAKHWAQLAYAQTFMNMAQGPQSLELMQAFSHGAKSLKSKNRTQSPLETSIKGIAQKLQRMPVHLITADVCKATVKMAVLDDDRLFQAIPHARLPFQNMWLELEADEELGTRPIGYFLEEAETEDGYEILVRKFICPKSNTKEVPFNNPIDDFAISKHGFRKISTGQYIDRKSQKDKKATLTDAKATEDIHDFFESVNDNTASFKERLEFDQNFDQDKMINIAGSHVLSIILLLNSRSKIVRPETEPREDKSALTKKRTGGFAKGRPIKLTPVTFDVDRAIKKGKAQTIDGAREYLYTTLRTGHWKIRKTGVFWWSDHTAAVTRQKDGTPTQNSEDIPDNVLVIKNRSVVKSDPNAEPFFPEI